MFFVGRLYFCFVGSLTVGFAIGGIKSKDVDVTISFSRYVIT